MDRDDQIQEASELMLEASARVWRAEWERKDVAREILATFGEGVLRAAARELSMTHRTWVRWAEDAARTPVELRQPDRSPQYQAREAR